MADSQKEVKVIGFFFLVFFFIFQDNFDYVQRTPFLGAKLTFISVNFLFHCFVFYDSFEQLNRLAFVP